MQLGVVVADRLLPGVADRVQQLATSSAAAPAPSPPVAPAPAPPVAAQSPAARRLSGELRSPSDNSSSSESSRVD